VQNNFCDGARSRGNPQLRATLVVRKTGKIAKKYAIDLQDRRALVR
jgi:hypothetical protein